VTEAASPPYRSVGRLLAVRTNHAEPNALDYSVQTESVTKFRQGGGLRCYRHYSGPFAAAASVRCLSHGPIARLSLSCR
jgi:hypothetical protein